MGEPGEALSARSNGEIRGDPVVTLGWFVCPTVSMVTTSKVSSLEKTLLYARIWFSPHRSPIEAVARICPISNV